MPLASPAWGGETPTGRGARARARTVGGGGGGKGALVRSTSFSYMPPSEEDALRNAEENRPMQVRGNHREEVPLGASTAELGKSLGVGIALYFQFLKYLVATLFFMFLMTAPVIVFANMGTYEGQFTEFYNETGTSALDSGFSLSSLTMGAVVQSSARGEDNPLRQSDKYLKVQDDFYVLKEDLLYAAMGSDLLAVIIFLIATLLIKRQIKIVADQVDVDTLDIGDYSMEVTGLPRDTEDPEEVRCFFELKYGEVAGVHLGRNDSSLLRLHQKKGQLKIQLERARARVAVYKKGEKKVVKLQERVAKVEQELKVAGKGPFQTTVAYVTFNSEESKVMCLYDSPNTFIGELLLPQDKKFRGRYSYKVKEAPAPSNVLYENLGYGAWFRLFMRSVVGLVVLVLLLVSFAGITVLKEEERIAAQRTEFDGDQLKDALLLQRQNQTGFSMADGATDLAQWAKRSESAQVTELCQNVLSDAARELSDNTTTYSIQYGRICVDEGGYMGDASHFSRCLASKDPFSDLGADDLVASLSACYNAPEGTCSPALANSMSCYCRGLALNVPVNQDTFVLLKSQCAPYVLDRVEVLAWRIGAVVLVVVINAVMKVVMRVLVNFEFWHSVTDVEKSVMIKTYVAQLFNTALLTLVIGADLPEVNKYLQGTPLQGGMFAGAYRDFDSKWYNEVGQALTITLVSQSLAPRLVVYMLLGVKSIQRKFLKGRALTQKDLDDIFLGIEFDISKEYAEVLMVITMVLMYGSGMPVLYLVGCVALLLKMWQDKYVLLRRCRKPVRMSSQLAESTVSVLLTSAILHLCFGIWMHSHFETPRIDQSLSSVVSISELSAAANSAVSSAALSAGAGAVGSGGVEANLTGAANATGLANGTALANSTAVYVPNVDLLALQSALPSREEGALNILPRALQTNAFPLLLFLVLILVGKIVVEYILVGVVGRTVKGLLLQIFGACFNLKGGSQYELEGIPAFDDALSSGKLEGLSTYAVEKNPKYADAFFQTTEELIQKEVEDSTDDVDMGELSRMLSMGGGYVP